MEKKCQAAGDFFRIFPSGKPDGDFQSHGGTQGGYPKTDGFCDGKSDKMDDVNGGSPMTQETTRWEATCSFLGPKKQIPICEFEMTHGDRKSWRYGMEDIIISKNLP